MCIMLLFLLAFTRTTFLLRKRRARIAYLLPYACVLVTLAQKLFTHNVFNVTAQSGYDRGPLMMVIYGAALLYGLAGLAYCIYCRRYLPLNQWASLLAIYVLVHLAVLIQFIYPELLVEMFFTAMAELLIMLTIMRPEERMDSAVGMLSWASYQSDLRNVILSRERVQIAVIQILNCRELRNYLGDHSFNRYISEIADKIRAVRWSHPRHIELYYERPGTIYLIADEDEANVEQLGRCLSSGADDDLKGHVGSDARVDSQICLIRCPDDLQNAGDIICLGHTFQKHGNRRQRVFHAGEMIHSQAFTIEAHIDEILERAIRDNNVEVYYQPIYDLRSGGFRSAEALARIIDPEYGLISPAIFIPAAEARGIIIPIGDRVMDKVFQISLSISGYWKKRVKLAKPTHLLPKMPRAGR